MTDPDSLRASLRTADAFVDANLALCCNELVQWIDTGILPDGILQEAADLYRKINHAQGMQMAENRVKYSSLRFVVSHV